MNKRGEWFSYRVTRVVFTIGVMALTYGALQFVLAAPGYRSSALVAIGIVLVALATRGPWDSISSGRNRSVLGFHARPGSDAEEKL
jgi:hypothetical protein